LIGAGKIARASAAIALLGAGLASCSRVTGLPAVPDSVTRRDAGLDTIDRWAEEARALAGERVEPGREPLALQALGARVAAHPDDLVIGNAFRMRVYRLKREFLAAELTRGERSPSLPDYLKDEPQGTLTRALASTPTRELRVQIALAYVDRMFLDPALEVRAPASIDSVHTFSAVLASDPHYIPALVGRGLNHLNRPRHLVWPEHPAPAADAASQDLSLAAAVGAKVGGASARVKGLLLLLLGDAYAHEGKAGLARSWWVLAGESTNDRTVQDELRIRASWPEPEMADRLEARLEQRMEDIDAPVSDLSFLWDDGARGPW
jgi:hypothetical protein